MSIEIKTPEQIAVMREAGLVVARTLRVLADAVRPGVTTAELDAIAEAEIRAAGATPSFKGYHGYPATICTSVNEEIVHGIPSPRRILRDGDIISIDCGAIVGGWHGDAALTVGVGAISAADAALLEACETALGRGPGLRPGMALAIEPMVMLGGAETVLLDDDWTVVTADGSRAAHFEHTVAITPEGPWVLTAADGGESGFAGHPGITETSLGDTRKKEKDPESVP